MGWAALNGTFLRRNQPHHILVTPKGLGKRTQKASSLTLFCVNDTSQFTSLEWVQEKEWIQSVGGTMSEKSINVIAEDYH